MTRKSTAAPKVTGLFAAALGMLLCPGAHASPAAGADSADAHAPAALYGHLREARGGDFALAQRTVDLAETRGRAESPAYGFLDRDLPQPTGLATRSTARVRADAGALPPRYRSAAAAPGVGAVLEASRSDLPDRLDYVFGSDLQLSSDRARRNESEVLLRNSDALVRAKLRMTLGREWLFVYGDMGPADSALKWQGLVGVRVGHGANLLGGWRRMTYYFSPGRDFDSLDFDGPFLAVQHAW